MSNKQYTNVFLRGDKIYVRGYDLGLPFKEVIDYKPYMFVEKQGGKYKTLQGKPVDKINFDSIKDAKEFVETYKDVENFNIYGFTDYVYTYINDYYSDMKYDVSKVKVGIIDLECTSLNGFPNIQLADQEITLITYRLNGKNAVFGCHDYTPKNNDTFYVKCDNEYQLFDKFLQVWESEKWSPDVITGWNIEGFDLPYLVNRIRKVCGNDFAKRLSPWKILYEKTFEYFGKEVQTFVPQGITVLDYINLYKKFSFGNHGSYKLDSVAFAVLGQKKLDYSQYKSIQEFYEKDKELFTDYNILDCELVDKLDQKLNFMGQVITMAYDSKILFIDTMGTVKAWDAIVHNTLLNNNIVVPQFKKAIHENSLMGGYVKDPKLGLSKWPVSFDLDSLYPSIIMGLNISPETKYKRIDDFMSIDDILDGKLNYKKYGDYVVAANGVLYSREKQGIFAYLMETYYSDRKKFKSMMIEAKKKFQETKDPIYKNQISHFHNMQMAKKIQINAFYGAMSNIYFRWFDFESAESITSTGQMTIKFIASQMNLFLNDKFNTKDVDYVLAVDTDSLYLCMEKCVEMSGLTDDKEIVEYLDQYSINFIKPFMDKSFKRLAKYINAYQQKMSMKRETIANKAIWRGKKMYIMNSWDIEGVRFDEPEMKISGIESVRSSTPMVCRNNIKETLKIIMNGNEQQMQDFILKFRNEFLKLSFTDVAFPRGVNDMKKYADKHNIYSKGCPIAVKGALLYNDMLKKKNITHIPPISDGTKVKFAYLKMPNIVQDRVIAVPDGIELDLELDEYIDRDMQFEKTFLSPIRSITDLIGWEVEPRSTLW